MLDGVDRNTNGHSFLDVDSFNGGVFDCSTHNSETKRTPMNFFLGLSHKF